MNGFATIKEKEMFILLTKQSIYPLAVYIHELYIYLQDLP